ncbi:hypothetical protein PIROE2DRAFT_18944 [Piromyces sp. E2]|nr:hypothetical protein PIROE2DRAFT_18944 [Piromyces sp. E2]|eukprot:OUM56452.1 hypothetical protein PIROE2DRAFT_18944 [Piromyces sp. E2]
MSEREDPPPFESIESYEGPPPYDDSKNKKFSKFIDIPDHEISVVKREYISKRHDTFCIRDGFSSFNSHTILVVDSDNREVFTLKEKTNCVVVYDLDKTPILNAYIEYGDYRHIFIFSGKKTDGIKYSIMRTENNINDDNKTFTVEFINKSTNREEEIEIRYARLTHMFEVYCNPNTPKEALICIITKNSKISKIYDIEIAPSVDYMFIFGITAALIRFETIRKIRNITKPGRSGLMYYYM